MEETYTIPQFQLDEEIINTFKRPDIRNDCVINALQGLGLLTQYTADYMRILKDKDKGIYRDIYSRIFSHAYKQTYKFINISSYDELISFSKNIYINHIIVVSYTFSSKRHLILSHVILIAKRDNGDVVIIDPQDKRYVKGLCNLLTDKNCNSSLKNAISVRILSQLE
jgi:hypothetical protein